ncbi:MAG: sigma-54 dependent transcriptional regulator [Cardiobacteriaceae bacterium]|nr:sigma-54 dependent transcriptional regulator [Cardiobacteriaceae bacterium]
MGTTANTANAQRVLIIDDERDIGDLIQMGIKGLGVQCEVVYGVKAAIKKLKEQSYQLVISDIRLPDGDGLDLLGHIQKHYPGIPTCMITAHGNMEMAIRALKLGAFDFINKPFDLKQLRAVCRSALDANKSQSALANLGAATEKSGKESKAPSSKHQLIGESEAMHEVRQVVEKVAKSQAPVFIHGESGTGKEVVARSIHLLGARKDAPFVAVNCGAIPENLVESEFFGYKKGAFTGANQDQNGLFVAANGGTLFLDEIADLPLSMQVKLLRAIQERAIRPIGGDKEEAVDVRIISATHRDLADLVRRGVFREDLYYRLNVIGITIPALRERLDDVSLLAEFLLARLSKNSGYGAMSLSQEALEKLQQYHFPGNVRELENILERALTFAEGKTIRAEDIQVRILPKTESVEDEKVEAISSSFLNLQALERQALEQALQVCKGDHLAAAKRLGISVTTLRYKLEQQGLL